MRDKFDFFNLLDDIVISGEVGMIKPEPEIFQHMLERIGTAASACLFIDDALANVEQAQKMGITAIQFHSPQQLEADLHEMGVL